MTLMKAGALILLLVVVGASIAGLALGGLGVFTGSTEEYGLEAARTDVVAPETAAPPTDASVVPPDEAAASMDPSALASAPAQVETATFALG